MSILIIGANFVSFGILAFPLCPDAVASRHQISGHLSHSALLPLLQHLPCSTAYESIGTTAGLLFLPSCVPSLGAHGCSIILCTIGLHPSSTTSPPPYPHLPSPVFAFFTIYQFLSLSRPSSSHSRPLFLHPHLTTTLRWLNSQPCTTSYCYSCGPVSHGAHGWCK